MALITIGPRETLVDRLTTGLREIARLDVGGLDGDLEYERNQLSTRLRALSEEASQLDVDWQDAYSLAVGEREAFESDAGFEAFDEGTTE